MASGNGPTISSARFGVILPYASRVQQCKWDIGRAGTAARTIRRLHAAAFSLSADASHRSQETERGQRQRLLSIPPHGDARSLSMRRALLAWDGCVRHRLRASRSIAGRQDAAARTDGAERSSGTCASVAPQGKAQVGFDPGWIRKNEPFECILARSGRTAITSHNISYVNSSHPKPPIAVVFGG